MASPRFELTRSQFIQTQAAAFSFGFASALLIALQLLPLL